MRCNDFIVVCILLSGFHYHIMHILLSLNRLSKTPFLKLTILRPLLICLWDSSTTALHY
jgi:hypothetical protein